MRRTVWSVLLCLVAGPHGTASAGDLSSAHRGDADDARRREDLSDRLDRLESAIAALQPGEAQRREEARRLVSDVLADAETRMALLQDGPTGGYDGKAFISSPDGRFRLSPWGFIQTRYVANSRRSEPDTDRWRSGFSVQRTRLYVDGNIEDISFRVRTTINDSGNANLDQAYLQMPVFEDFQLRVGQFMLPLFHDEWVAAEKQLAVNQSVVNTIFAQGQSQGVWLSRTWDTVRMWASFNDGARTDNTAALSGEDADAAVTGRVEFRFGEGDWGRFDDYTSFPGEPFGGYIGFAGHFETGSELPQSTGDKLAYGTGEIGLEGDGWNVYALGVVAYDDFNTPGSDYALDFGFLLQGGVFIAPTVEIFSRFDWVEGGDERPADDPFRSITGGFNWYITPNAHRLKLTANVIYFMDPTVNRIVTTSSSVGLLESSRSGQAAIQVQMQLIF